MLRIFTLMVLFSITFSHAQLSFQDSATAKGVGYSYGASIYGGGVSFCDFNDDGWDDLTYSTTDGQQLKFFQNNNGTFIEVDLGISNVERVKQVLWVDYDNDGDKDFMATSISGFNKYYRNDGNLTFTDVTATIGFFTNNLYTYGISFGDIDNDGDLDALIANRDNVNANNYSYLYRNQGNGTFIEITESAGLNLNNELSFCSAFFDYDNDGDQDIYIANDKSPNPNRLYQNDGSGMFTDVSAISGSGIIIDAMSTTIGDYNNDGWFDIYVTNTTAGNVLLQNNGDGSFLNVSPTVGTEMNTISWGSVFLDADNDADLDLYVSSSMTGVIPTLMSSAFFENDGVNNYSIPAGAGFANDTRKSFANAIGDFNNDGLPDIVVMNDTDNYFLWENTTTNSNNYLKVKLEGTTSNKGGIGSKIEVAINGNSQFRYTLCGEGYISQNSGTEIIGFGSATVADYVKVTWPSGIVDIIDNVTANQVLTVVEGSSLSTETYNIANGLSIHPNPTQGIVTVNNLKSNVELSIYNILGKQLATKTLTMVKNKVDISNYSKGVYLFSLKDHAGNLTTKKVVLQ
ncbi:FG-GAP-like repeat-containing protein [Lacinutrix sp.]|uniref:FG-GAP-like repeat-containing protein n=1 Tax=Lacinutrix sp. TaxID=1937692 RepID=UPI0026177713|nr:FG-GAP-like repeat-containing protein [Lacinutrix sp.]MDG1715205.1 FG-GAP-like repeat-containing protein [Lacinutrix sp.]